MEHVLHEVEGAESRCLGTYERTSPRDAFARQYAGVVFACELLVHAVEVAYFAAAHAYVACGHVGVGADILPQLKHESLAETHDLGIRLALGAEVRASLCAAHGQRGEGVLERLLETEELEHREIDGAVEAQSSLVGAYRAVELNAVADVGLDLTLVVDPRYAEGDDTVGLDHTLDDLCLLEFGVFVVYLLDRLEDLAYCLQILVFTGVFTLEICHYIVNVHNS